MTSNSTAPSGKGAAPKLDIWEIHAEKHTTPCSQASSAKALLIDILARILEMSPGLAHRLSTLALAVWPGMRGA
jgi:hypothetical protein